MFDPTIFDQQPSYGTPDGLMNMLQQAPTQVPQMQQPVQGAPEMNWFQRFTAPDPDTGFNSLQNIGLMMMAMDNPAQAAQMAQFARSMYKSPRQKEEETLRHEMLKRQAEMSGVSLEGAKEKLGDYRKGKGREEKARAAIGKVLSDNGWDAALADSISPSALEKLMGGGVEKLTVAELRKEAPKIVQEDQRSANNVSAANAGMPENFRAPAPKVRSVEEVMQLILQAQDAAQKAAKGELTVPASTGTKNEKTWEEVMGGL